MKPSNPQSPIPDQQSHTIRLRDPWQCQRSSETALYRRRFGRPTGLEQGERVYLVIERAGGMGRVTLNGVPLDFGASDGSGLQQDVTALLNERNELTIAVVPSHGVLGEVRVEIRTVGT